MPPHPFDFQIPRPMRVEVSIKETSNLADAASIVLTVWVKLSDSAERGIEISRQGIASKIPNDCRSCTSSNYDSERRSGGQRPLVGVNVTVKVVAS